jgi:hypothetical protein
MCMIAKYNYKRLNVIAFCKGIYIGLQLQSSTIMTLIILPTKGNK